MADSLYSETYIGTVLKIDKEKRKIGVYIPKLMSNIDGGDVIEYDVPTNAGLNITNITTNISATVHKINYIWVPSIDYNEPLPKVGSKVRIFFIDENPELRYWEKFNVNNDYNVIEEEKYPKLYNLKVGEKQYNISTEDNVIIELPPYFDITTVNSDNAKEKKIKINEKFNFHFKYGLEESITKLQKSIDFLETQYEQKFITDINQIILDTKSVSPATSASLIKYFDSYKQTAVDKIIKSKDLSDSNEIYQYYYKLFSGLKKSCDDYKIYLQKYKDFNNKNLYPSITENSINQLIVSIFQKSEDVSNENNIDNYYNYLINIFSPDITFEYHYRTSEGLNENNLISTSPVFELVSASTVNALPELSDISPDLSFQKSINKILSSKFFLYSWNDEGDEIIFRKTKSDTEFVNTTYYAISNNKVYPKFYGLYLCVNNDNKLELNIFNSTNLDVLGDIESSLKINNNNKTINKKFTTLESLNTFLKTIDINDPNISILEFIAKLNMKDPKDTTIEFAPIVLTEITK